MPWPAGFDAMKRGEGCAICEEGRPEESPFGVRFFEGRYPDAYLQKEAMQRGWAVAYEKGCFTCAIPSAAPRSKKK